MLSKKVIAIVLLFNLAVLAPVQVAFADWTYVPAWTEYFSSSGDGGMEEVHHPAGWKNDTGGFVMGEKKPTQGSGKWIWTPSAQQLMGSGDSSYYEVTSAGWTDILTQEFQPGTQGDPPGDVVREIGNINSESIGLWGMVYQDRYGVFYNQGRRLDPAVFTPARIAAERQGTATAEAQAVADDDDGFFSNPFVRLALTVVLTMNGVPPGFLESGLVTAVEVGSGTLVGSMATLYGVGPAVSTLLGAIVVNTVVQEAIFCVTGYTCDSDSSPFGATGATPGTIPSTPVVEGGTCYGPVNSCNQSYEGTWQASICSAPNYAPPDSGCPASPSTPSTPTTPTTPADVTGGTGGTNSTSGGTGGTGDTGSTPADVTGGTGGTNSRSGGTGGTGGGTGSTPRSCTPQLLCSGSNVYSRSAACADTLVERCDYGCSSGACNPPPSMEFIPFDATNASGTGAAGSFTATGHLQIRPMLVRKGDSTWLYWNIINASSCTVTGTNGDSWNDRSSGSAGKQTKTITSQTTYTLSCVALPGATIHSISESQKVDVAPIFEEV